MSRLIKLFALALIAITAIGFIVYNIFFMYKEIEKLNEVDDEEEPESEPEPEPEREEPKPEPKPEPTII